MQLIEEFKDKVLDSTSFQVGYLGDSQQAMIWLVTREDLKRTYKIQYTTYVV